VILARPTKSEMLFVQIVGRALRLAKDKSDALIFDHANIHIGSKDSLGFVTDIHHEHLDNGTQRKAQAPRERPKLRECSNPDCRFVQPVKFPKCMACGFQPERKSEIEVKEGELFELGAKQTKKSQVSQQEKQRWYSAFFRLAGERGYKRKWPDAKFRDKFGHWPRGLDERAGSVDPDIRSWIKSQDIRYAKRRQHVPEARL
jgi:DNA repair protein RadD